MAQLMLDVPDPLAMEIASRLPEGETLETAALKALKMLLRDAIIREESVSWSRRARNG